MTAHWKLDLVYWLVFFAGQLLFLLKRADLARRSPLNGMASIGQFFALNWITILFRSALEFAVILYPYRHVDMAWLMSKFGWNLPFQIPQSVVLAFLLGLFSDLIMDWLAMQDTLLGIKVPKIFKENVPQLPEVKQLVENLPATKG